jgi:hypothetical protein
MFPQPSTESHSDTPPKWSNPRQDCAAMIVETPKKKVHICIGMYQQNYRAANGDGR